MLRDELRPAWSAAVRAEWTKLRTLPSTTWLLAGTVAVTVGTTAIIAAATHTSTGPDAARQDPTKLALTGIDLGQAIIAVLAVLTVCEEYGAGMIRITLTAMPRRTVVLAAKAVNLTGLTLIAGLVAVAGCLMTGRLMLPGAGLGTADGYPLVSLAHTATLRAAAGSVLYLILIALLVLGIATAIRDTAVSVGVVLALLYLPPLLAQAVSDPLRRHLEQIAPMTAGLAVQVTTSSPAQVIAPWAGLGILAMWAAGSLTTAGVLLRIRDA
ncbi:ABC transporter permease [Leekyejoonella antrihumi]|uniref:ABC transporter permease n=1 Tax=Leekyejoonella antrihumi TaxID=1660198 RepID=A0A563E418_9MICO|nr:ABC transporter permease [Leekyejoonella antrihumi]